MVRSLREHTLRLYEHTIPSPCAHLWSLRAKRSNLPSLWANWPSGSGDCFVAALLATSFVESLVVFRVSPPGLNGFGCIRFLPSLPAPKILDRIALMRMVPVFLFFCVILLASPAGSEEAASPEGLFREGLSLEGAGRFEEAASALEAVCDGDPGHPLTDDACFRLGTLFDKHLYDYGRVVAAYASLAERFPSSRHAAWAVRRIEELGRLRAAGDAPLARYERVLAEYAKRDKGELIAEMEGILADHPDFPLVPKVHVWLGGELRRQGRLEASEAHYRRAMAAAPGSDEAMHGTRALGDLSFEAGDYSAATELYGRLAASDDPTWQRAGAQLVAQMEEHGVRRLVARALAVFLAVSVLVLLAGIVRGRARLAALASLRWEVSAAVALGAGVFVALGSKASFIRNAAFSVAAATVGLVMVSGLFLSVARPGRGTRVGYPIWVAFMAVSMIYLIFHYYDLLFVLEDTIRFGPD